MNNLPLMSLTVNMKDYASHNNDIENLLKPSLDTYEIYMDIYKMSEPDRKFIIDQAKGWVDNICKAYKDKICHCDDFYNTQKTPTFSMQIRATFLLY